VAFTFIFLRTPSLAAGQLECGWYETVLLMPVGYGDLFAVLLAVALRNVNPVSILRNHVGARIGIPMLTLN